MEYTPPKPNLSEKMIESLANLPEAGMDYQQVDFEFADGSIIENVTVVGCRLAMLPEGIDPRKIVGILSTRDRFGNVIA